MELEEQLKPLGIEPTGSTFDLWACSKGHKVASTTDAPDEEAVLDLQIVHDCIYHGCTEPLAVVHRAIPDYRFIGTDIDVPIADVLP
jgi:hypothetical protein